MNRSTRRSLRIEQLEGRAMFAAAGVGVFRPDVGGQGQFELRESASAGAAEIVARIGLAGAKPVVGDFDGDGIDTIAIFDAAGQWAIQNENRSPNPPNVFDFPTFTYGAGHFIPVAGDWDGDGVDSIGVFDPISATWYLRNSVSPGAPDIAPFSFGGSNFVPVVGDWNGDGFDTIGAFDPTTGIWYLRNSNDPGVANAGAFAFGGPGFKPVVADFDGLPFGDGIAVVSPNQQWFVRHTATPGAPDIAPFVYGAASSSVVAGIFGGSADQLTENDVEQLLAIAGQASQSNDAIIAIVDRNGEILGVRVESGVPISPMDRAVYVSAIDGAVAKARTAAYFANNDAPIISSRTIRFLSQSTITERQVNSNPNTFDAFLRGPAQVAPIGLGGHFPPGVAFTPPVDLFSIETTNRDSLIHPGPDHLRGTPDDITLTGRFDIDPGYVPPGQKLEIPESYAFPFNEADPNFLPSAQARGIATLPGGIPIVNKNSTGKLEVIGGIGVFFPGPNGFASYEQGYVPGYVQTEQDRVNAPRVLEAEWIAYATSAAASGTLPPDLQAKLAPDLNVFDIDFGFPSVDALLNTLRLDLVGITLETIGPHPDGVKYTQAGLLTILDVGRRVGQDAAPIIGGPLDVNVTPTDQYLPGKDVPEGWLVLPHDSAVDPITALDVQKIIEDGIGQANLTRAALRLPLGNRTKMVFAVADKSGEVLGLYRMDDSTVFSIDVAVAKSRNTGYYADAASIQMIDRVPTTVGGALLPPGVAFTNRTVRFLAEPRFPSGVENSLAGYFSILNDPGLATDPRTGRPGAESIPGSMVAYTQFQSVLGFDSFNPGTNFRDPNDIAHQNGVVFFPGSTPLYKNTALVGGFGVSGDGVDQDDTVSFIGATGYLPPSNVLRADQVFVRNVRLPFMKFLRNPEG